MNFHFSYDIYPHPPYYSNNEKANTENKKMLANSLFQVEHQNQLDCRPKLTKCCRYNDKNKDHLPSSCNYIGCEKEDVYIPNVGYYKHYFQNINIESELLHSKPSKPINKPLNHSHTQLQPCIEKCGELTKIKDSSFTWKNSKIWNNNTKRRYL